MALHRAVGSGRVSITPENGSTDAVLIRVGRAYDDDDPRIAAAMAKAPGLFGIDGVTETASAGKRNTRIPKRAPKTNDGDAP